MRRFIYGRVGPKVPTTTVTVSVPVNSSLPVVSGTPTNGQTLSATTGSWVGSPTSFAYQWRRNGTDISGATGSSYTLTTADVGALVNCGVTAINTAGPSLPAYSLALGPVIDIAPPVNTVAPAISGTAQKGQILSCSAGTWSNSPIAFAYQWQRNGVSISGAISSTYTVVAADVSQGIQCVVTATNTAGPASANSNTVTPIDLAPQNIVAPVASGIPTVGQTLSVTNGTWTNPPTSYSYQWLDGGSPISGANASTYTLVSGDAGFNVSCRVTATNTGGSQAATSNALGPVGVAPSVPTNDGTVANAPTLTGIPRQSEAAWTGAGNWTGGVPNKYRFDVQADGVSLTSVSITDNGTTTTASFPFDTTSTSIEFAWPASAVGHAPTLTVKASLDSGATWSSAATAQLNFTFQSDLITPATIATPTLTRNTASGVVPMVYTISGVDLYNSYLIRQRRFTHAGVFIEENFVPVSESGLTSLSLDASTSADPAPYPAPLGTLATDDVIHVTIISSDYNQDSSTLLSGVTSGDASVSPSDALSAMTWSTTDDYSSSEANTYASGNLAFTHPGAGIGSVRGSRAVGFDLTYWEEAGTNDGIGIADTVADLTVEWGSATDGYTATTHAAVYYNRNGGQIAYNGGPRGDVGAATGTDVRQIWLDRVNKIVWFGKNGTCLNGVPGTSGGLSIPGLSNFYPAMQCQTAQTGTANFGTTPGGTAGFTYTPTGGFVAP